MFAIQLSGCKQQPVVQDYAEVISIASGITKYTLNKRTVTFRSTSGLVGSRIIDADELFCKEGDTIKVRAQGIALTMEEHECTR